MRLSWLGQFVVIPGTLHDDFRGMDPHARDVSTLREVSHCKAPEIHRSQAAMEAAIVSIRSLKRRRRRKCDDGASSRP